MFNMKRLFLFLAFFALAAITNSAFAKKNYTELKDIDLYFTEDLAKNAWTFLESNPDFILREFKPVGAKITNLEVQSTTPPRIIFKASPKSDAAQKLAWFLGVETNQIVAELEILPHSCSEKKPGSHWILSLERSDEAIRSQAKALEIFFCPIERSDSFLEFKGKTRLIHGPEHGKGILGPKTVEFIEWQIGPLWRAIQNSYQKALSRRV
jgi:hypothetical protein